MKLTQTFYPNYRCTDGRACCKFGLLNLVHHQFAHPSFFLSCAILVALYPFFSNINLPP